MGEFTQLCKYYETAGSLKTSSQKYFSWRNEKIHNISMFFRLGQGGRRCRITLECKEKVY